MKILLISICFSLFYCQTVYSKIGRHHLPEHLETDKRHHSPDHIEKRFTIFVNSSDEYNDTWPKFFQQRVSKRGFNQNYKGTIVEQNNIEALQTSNFHGEIRTQVNVDNEGQTGPVKCRKRRGFNQNYHGTIHKQNNVESSVENNHFGDIMSQLNVHNEEEETPECLPETLPNNRFKTTTDASFQQNYKGPIGEQNNLEQLNESNYYGDIKTQVNAENTRIPLGQVITTPAPYRRPTPNRRPYNQQSPNRRPYNQQSPNRRPYNQPSPYRKPYNQPSPYRRPSYGRPVSHGFRQKISGPIYQQQNYENHQTGNYYGNHHSQHNYHAHKRGNKRWFQKSINLLLN